EIECRGKIAAHRSPPITDILLTYPEALFRELDDRGVVEQFGADIAAAAPWADHDRRHAYAEANRMAARIGDALRPVILDLACDRHRAETLFGRHWRNG